MIVQENLFTYRDKYPHSPAYRRRRPTSKAGADHIKPRAPTLRDRVLRLLQDSKGGIPAPYASGLTADECARILGITVLSCRPRLSELLRLGHIYDSGETRRNASGVSAVVWRAF